MIEEWREIIGTEGRYEVSSLGGLRSWAKQGSPLPRARSTPVAMTPYPSDGYLLINLRINGRYVCKTVNHLMAEAFIGPRPTPSHEAAHLDGRKDHNVRENIVWATPKVNSSHKSNHGTQAKQRMTCIIDGVLCYQCTGCEEWVPREGFHTINHGVCGVASACRRCAV